MSIASNEDAQFLLGRLLRCDECGDWTVAPSHPGTLVIDGGVTDEQGRRTRLSVELQVRAQQGSSAITYVFSVFNSIGYDVERVYQLEVIQGRARARDAHRRSHEHFGPDRIMGANDWATWSYNELLRYFSSRTNITFSPQPPDPGLLLRRKR